MPQMVVVLEIHYRREQTERSERRNVRFESWPLFNVETEWPKVQEHLQKLRVREKLGNCTVHYYNSSSEHLELRDASSLAALTQWVRPQNESKVIVPLRFIPPLTLRDGNGDETAYDLSRCVGRGAFGIVFEVRSQVDKTFRALKMSFPGDTYLQSMRNEIATLLELDHPNIIRPLITGDVLDPNHGPLPAFLMELGLYDVAALQSEQYKKAAAKAVVEQVTPALLYLYEKGFGHMDLKPSNMLVTNESACEDEDDEDEELELEIKLIDAGGAGKLGTNLVTQRTKEFSDPILFSGNGQPPVSFCQDLFSLIKTVRELAGSHFTIVLDLLDDLSHIAERFGDNRDAVIEGVRFEPQGAKYRTVFSLRRRAFRFDMGEITLSLSSEFARKKLRELHFNHQPSNGQDFLLRFALLEWMTLDEQWDDAAFVRDAMQVHPCALMFASEHLQKEAVRRKGSNLQFVSEALQADGPLVLEAVQQDVSALQFASKGLQSLRSIVLAAVSRNGSSLQFASGDLQSDRQVVLAAISQNGSSLQFASGDLQSDRQVVLAAVSQNGSALQFASGDLQSDRQVVLAAVSQNGSALQFASGDLRSDRQVVLQAVRQHRSALQFAERNLQEDETIVQEAAEVCPYVAIGKLCRTSQFSEYGRCKHYLEGRCTVRRCKFCHCRPAMM